MRFRTHTICAALLAAAPLAAVGETEALTQAALADRRTSNFLGVKAGSGFTFEHSELIAAGDLNADERADQVLVLRNRSASVVSVFLGQAEGDPKYAGSIRLDASAAPTVAMADVTGDGRVDVCVEYSKAAGSGATAVGVVYAEVRDGGLAELFRGLREESERNGAHARRATHSLRFDDADGDGLNELEVTSQVVESLGAAGAEKVVEGTLVQTTGIYKLKDGRYELLRLQRTLASPEKQLEAAMEMLDAGVVDRATQITADLGDKALSNATITERSATILRESNKPEPAPAAGADQPPVEVAKPNDPDAPATA